MSAFGLRMAFFVGVMAGSWLGTDTASSAAAVPDQQRPAHTRSVPTHEFSVPSDAVAVDTHRPDASERVRAMISSERERARERRTNPDDASTELDRTVPSATYSAADVDPGRMVAEELTEHRVALSHGEEPPSHLPEPGQQRPQQAPQPARTRPAPQHPSTAGDSGGPTSEPLSSGKPQPPPASARPPGQTRTSDESQHNRPDSRTEADRTDTSPAATLSPRERHVSAPPRPHESTPDRLPLPVPAPPPSSVAVPATGPVPAPNGLRGVATLRYQLMCDSGPESEHVERPAAVRASGVVPDGPSASPD